MSAELILYGRPVGTVFDLLGSKENDITYSLGWALAESEGAVECSTRGRGPGIEGRAHRSA
jgi:hypothetical protein